MGFHNEVYMSTTPLYTKEEVKDIVHTIDNAKQKYEEPKENSAYAHGEKKVKVTCIAFKPSFNPVSIRTSWPRFSSKIPPRWRIS